MTLGNNAPIVVDAFRKLAKEGERNDKFNAKIMLGLRDAGLTPDDIKGDGDAYPHFLEGIARGVLTAKQYNLFTDESRATKINRRLTPRGNLKARVSSRASKVRAMYQRFCAEPAKRGPGKSRTKSEIMRDTVTSYVEWIVKNKDSDTFDKTWGSDCDAIEVRAALLQVAKLLK